MRLRSLWETTRLRQAEEFSVYHQLSLSIALFLGLTAPFIIAAQPAAGGRLTAQNRSLIGANRGVFARHLLTRMNERTRGSTKRGHKQTSEPCQFRVTQLSLPSLLASFLTFCRPAFLPCLAFFLLALFLAYFLSPFLLSYSLLSPCVSSNNQREGQFETIRAHFGA